MTPQVTNAIYEPLDSDKVRQYTRLIESNPSLEVNLWPKWSPYIPHEPTGKQLAFLMLPHMEALYGGAAGGGKSDALLMAALQYVDVPGYSAILFRKTFADLSLPGALIDRAHSWLGDTPAKWSGMQHTWTFACPGGGTSTIAFGYLQAPLDKYRYQSAEFQFVGFDEATQQWEEDYLYLFSRLRRKRCPYHVNDPSLPPEGHPQCNTCREYAPLSRVPLRMRAATNPGGIGHLWVKNRFSITNIKGVYRGTNPMRPYVPALIYDNPFLDQSEYVKSLSNLDPITREQLLRGDWGVSAEGRFKKKWVRYYSTSGDYVVLGRDRKGPPHHINTCRLFLTVDPAASAREGLAEVFRGAPSWTVISTWLLTTDYNLIWWHVLRFREEVPDVVDKIKRAYRRCIETGLGSPEFIGVEANGLGIGVFQTALRMGLPVRDLKPRSMDKVVRATDAMNRMEMGKIWLPEQSPWLEECESELFTWTGHPQEQADQIDTLAYAAMMVSEEATSMESSPNNALPFAGESFGDRRISY